MIRKIQRKHFLIDNPDFPQTNYRTGESTYPESYSNYLFTLDSKSAKGHARLLSVELSKLVKNMGFGRIRFLGDTNIPWLFRDHDYKPVHDALNYIRENKVSKTFSGALEIDIANLPEFFINLYWLVRCNGVVNYVYFSDAENNILGNICQYGSVHFSVLNKGTDEVFESEIQRTKFKLMSDRDCADPFSKTSTIKHRQVTI